MKMYTYSEVSYINFEICTYDENVSIYDKEAVHRNIQRISDINTQYKRSDVIDRLLLTDKGVLLP